MNFMEHQHKIKTHGGKLHHFNNHLLNESNLISVLGNTFLPIRFENSAG